MSERALKEVPSENCHKCGNPFLSDDVIVLNCDDAEFEVMQQRMVERRAKAKQSKKNKKKNTETDMSEPKAKSAKTEDTKAKGKGKATPATGENGCAKQKSTDKKPASIQKDPNATEAYKSLFTSSDEAKKQSAQHSGWVSFNPQYFR